MDFNKIPEYLKKKNIKLKEFIPMNTSLKVDGFRYSIKNETLRVIDLESISKALNVPVSFWWDEEKLNVVNDYKEKYFNKLEEENTYLKERLRKCDKTEENLRMQIDELRERLGLKKEGTYGL